MTDSAFEHLRHEAPLRIFDEWLTLARQAETVEPGAMTLATVDAKGMPQARTVLLKAHGDDGFFFYTNSRSRKGEALRQTAAAALLFYWRALGRQISVEGAVRQLSAAETEPYYHSRPRASRLGAWASRQSEPLATLADLRAAMAAREAEFAGREPPLPPTWRGYCVQPLRMEFWRQGDDRLHQRLVFTRRRAEDDWQSGLLQP